MVNPDGAEYDLTGRPVSGVAQEPPAEQRHDSDVGTDLNRNYGYRWGCCGGSSGTKSSSTYRGSKAFSAPESKALAATSSTAAWSAVVSRSRLAITFHTAGEQILWPYGYTRTDVPDDMTVDDHAALVAIGKAMAKPNGYTPMQSSSLYVTDGDEIDWAYGV